MKSKIEKIGLKDDKNKLRYDLITVESIKGMAEVLTYGAKKYKPNSWQNLEDGINKHYAATMRHIMKWRSGEENDEDTNLHHLKHAMTNLMFLIYHDMENKK